MRLLFNLTWLLIYTINEQKLQYNHGLTYFMQCGGKVTGLDYQGCGFNRPHIHNLRSPFLVGVHIGACSFLCRWAKRFLPICVHSYQQELSKSCIEAGVGFRVRVSRMSTTHTKRNLGSTTRRCDHH